MAVTANSEDFSAWIDRMPGSDGKLIVQGHVVVPTGGWTGSLVEAVPQGINPAILILGAQLTKPTGNVTQAETELPLRFEKPRSPAYESVTIRGLGDDVTIPVTEAH